MRPVRRFRVYQGTKHILQKHIFIQNILYIIQQLIVIKIFRNRIFRLFHIPGIGNDIHA